jgi:hypothetical protein
LSTSRRPRHQLDQLVEARLQVEGLEQRLLLRRRDVDQPAM